MMIRSTATVLAILVLTSTSLARADQEAIQIPIGQFAQVTPNLLRGARPGEDGIAALKALEVKTDLDLENDDNAIAAEKSWATSAGIDFVSEPMSGFFAPDDATVDRIFQVLRDPNQFPVFVHCQHGQDRTGLIIGLYRVFDQKWTPKDTYNEMLAKGFHPILLGLNHYFKETTNYDDGDLTDWLANAF